MKHVSIPRAEQQILRLQAGDTLPETLLQHLRREKITGGWLRLTGVLADVEVRAYSSEIEGPGGTRRIAGPLQAIVLDGSLGMAGGDVSVDLRVVLARESDRGLETVAGQLVRARVVGLDGSLTHFEATIVPRALDKGASVWLLDADGVIDAPTLVESPRAPSPHPPPRAEARVEPAAPAWAEPNTSSSLTQVTRAPVPLAPPGRPSRPTLDDADESEEQVYPQAGDLAEHFAFGACEVLKSDGDRLHVRMKDGRIREIALEMLRVVPLPREGGAQQRFRLSRKG